MQRLQNLGKKFHDDDLDDDDDDEGDDEVRFIKYQIIS